MLIAARCLGRIILDSGAADWIGTVMAVGLDYLSPAAALAAIMLAMTFLTNFASNATAATVGTPIAFAIATKLGLPAEPLVLAALFGCTLVANADRLSDKYADYGRGLLRLRTTSAPASLVGSW